MERFTSRRSFLKKSAITLGTAAVYDFKGIGSAEQVSGYKILSGEELTEGIDPHVIVKLYPGRSEQQKIRLAEAIVKDVVAIIHYKVRRRIGFSSYRRNQTRGLGREGLQTGYS